MKKLLIAASVVAALLMIPGAAMAQSNDQEASLFVGYSLLRPELEGANRGTTHGIVADYTYFMDRRFGFALSGAVYFGTVEPGENAFQVPKADFRQYTFLGGPHATLWRTLTSELGIRGLAGASSRQLKGANTGVDFGKEWGFTTGAEAHLDFRLSDRIWLRALQPGVLWTNFDGNWQMNWRVSAGLVLNAGEILQ